MSNVIGIDPGIKGGFSFFNHGDLLETMSMPIVNKEIDINKIYEFFMAIDRAVGIDIVILEDVHAIFGTGAKQTFNFGRNLGILEGIIGTLKLPYKKVKPRAWQKVSWQGIPNMKKSGKNDTKGMSLVAVNRLFPTKKEMFLATDRSRVPHEGIVDAVLIAYSQI